MLSTFLVEVDLKEEPVGVYETYSQCNRFIDKPDGDNRITLYTLSIYLVTPHEEKGESCIKFTRRQATLGMLGASVNLSSAGEKVLFLRSTGGLFLWTGRDCFDQTWHNDFEVQKLL